MITTTAPARASRPSRLPGLGAVLAMWLGVMVVYLPAPPAQPSPDGAKSTLFGGDFLYLHQHRLSFAREALFGPSHTLPGWYGRELGGAPFWANVQNFPFIPTRLALLPAPEEATYGLGVQLAALLSALFTFLFCRSLQMGRVGAAAAGWTFACAGFFAARVTAGHLPLLEAYPSLPLLLWLVELNLQARSGQGRLWLRRIGLALAATSAALAGHPQLPFYALLSAGLYVFWRAPDRRGLHLALLLGAGLLMAGFALWPMSRLVAQSTRVLDLEVADNDLAFPYNRVGAFFLPWKDGWPAYLHKPHSPAAPEWATADYSEDTVCYVGWLPLLAAGCFLLRALQKKAPPSRAGLFIAGLGLLALLFALPWWKALMSILPGTILRSPCRQLYLTTFALAFALGAAADLAVRTAIARKSPVLAVLTAGLLVLHGLDLGWHHDRPFVFRASLPTDMPPLQTAALRKQVGHQRIATSAGLPLSFVRQIDDVGVFDSLLLAKPYRSLLEISGTPIRANLQFIDGPALPLRTLQFFGVSRIFSQSPRSDAPPSPAGGLFDYSVPNPLPRASLRALSATKFLENESLHGLLRRPAFDFSSTLLLPTHAPQPPEGPPASGPSSLTLERLSSDDALLRLNSPWPSYALLLDSWHPGWSATLDGKPAPVIPAFDTFMAVPVPPGAHEVRLHFSTPGWAAGLLLSALGMLATAALARHPQPTSPGPSD